MAEMLVEYDDHMGDDLMVVNRARVSFKNKSEWVEDVGIHTGERTGNKLSKKDRNLIAYLARGCPTAEWEGMIRTLQETSDPHVISRILYKVKNMATHWAPFSHPKVSLYMKIPIAIARQIYKHQIGFEYSEVSRRYVADDPEFYTVDKWREAEADVKQGSSDREHDMSAPVYNDGPQIYNLDLKGWYNSNQESSSELYQRMIENEVCAEQARFGLPQSMMTEFFVTGSLYGWARVYNQRSDAHAQKESQYIAEKINGIVKPLFPESWYQLTRKS